MKREKIMLGILAITLVFAMAFVSCDDSPNVDPSLNGTWISSPGYGYTFNNANWEALVGGSPGVKGTYTTSDDQITMTVTHHYLYLDQGAGWFSRNDMIAAGTPESQIDQLFFSFIYTYAISGDTLTMTSSNGVSTYTRN